MRDKSIQSDWEFVRTLTDVQRKYFLGRVQRHRSALQESLRELSRVLSTINELHDEAVLTALHQAASRQE